MDIQRIDEHTVEVSIQRHSLTIGPKFVTAGDVHLATQQNSSGDNELKTGYFQEPGEYEVQGVMVDGIETGPGIVSYHIVQDGVSCAAVVLNKSEDLTDAIVESLQPAQVLLIWLGVGEVSDLTSLLGKLEAAVIVPITLPFGIDELEKAVQMPQETTAKAKLLVKELTPDQPKLIILT